MIKFNDYTDALKGVDFNGQEVNIVKFNGTSVWAKPMGNLLINVDGATRSPMDVIQRNGSNEPGASIGFITAGAQVYYGDSLLLNNVLYEENGAVLEVFSENPNIQLQTANFLSVKAGLVLPSVQTSYYLIWIKYNFLLSNDTYSKVKFQILANGIAYGDPVIVTSPEDMIVEVSETVPVDDIGSLSFNLQITFYGDNTSGGTISSYTLSTYSSADTFESAAMKDYKAGDFIFQ